jgi:hypothetical protein
MVADRPNFLAAAAAAGDGCVLLVEPIPDSCLLLIDSGSPRWEQIRVYRCTGNGPYHAWLGLNDRTRAQLDFAHMATTTVEVSDG